MIWWTSQPSRARSERIAIAELEDRCAWLDKVSWRLTKDLTLCADFEIDRNGEGIALTIAYSSFFPDTPPQVRPRDDVRLSGHQYGAGGELCLEYRPDNWDPSYTGAMMIESAFRLLAGEAPPPGEEAEVPDAHRTTLGQDIRNTNLRFVLPEDARKELAEIPLAKIVEAEIVEHFIAGRWLAHLWRLGSEGEYWDAAGRSPKFRIRKGVFVRLDASFTGTVKAEYDFVDAIISVAGREDLSDRLAQSADELVVIVECDGTVRMMSLGAGEGRRKVYNYRTVRAPNAADRLPQAYKRLAQASVAVVGCGSAGSKIAASLARAGVGRFVLVDGDVLFADNLVRNDLGWTAVGLNKPDAVKARIADINPAAAVGSFRVGLGTQESSTQTDAALVAIGGCDVVIDATAEPQVFNLCAAAARYEKKTLVWGEVFAGGIGGLIARLHPDRDPIPHAARRQIHQWCDDRGVDPPQGSAVQYRLDLPEGAPPVIADDADVAIIASHMTRMALDALTSEETNYPQSAYAIGLKAGWIFEAPFDTWPIALVPEGEWGPERDANLTEELEALAHELFPVAKDVGDEP